MRTFLLVANTLVFTFAFFLNSMTTSNTRVIHSNADTTIPSNQNPLLSKWQGPYGGVPPFDQVKVSDFKPALEAAMTENLKEVHLIASSSYKPVFENTIAELERSGRTLDRVLTIYGIWSSTMNTPDFQIIEREMAPKLAAFSDQITQ